jgi:hypothetical protein
MENDNHGSQSGNGSINVGNGDFRNANIQIGNQNNQYNQSFTAQQIQVERKLLLGGASVQRENLSVFSYVSGLTGIAGLYFTIYSPSRQPHYASWSTAFYFLLAIGVLSWILSMVLKRKSFTYLMVGTIYAEEAPNGRVYLTKLKAVCPWCGSKMTLRHYAPKDATPRDIFFCERNPIQHNITCDHTFLPAVDPAGQ